MVASSSYDKSIFLWRTYGDCENFMMLQACWGNGAALDACSSGILLLAVTSALSRMLPALSEQLGAGSATA